MIPEILLVELGAFIVCFAPSQVIRLSQAQLVDIQVSVKSLYPFVRYVNVGDNLSLVRKHVYS